MNLVGNHERGIKTEAEMSDYLILIGLALIFLQEFTGTRESNLCDVLLHLVICHTDTVVDELQCLVVRIDFNMYLILVLAFRSEFSDAFKLFQFCDGITCICHLLTYKYIVV